MSRDRRAEPLVSQRVPYVIVYGTPGLPLIELVREPHELVADRSLHINATYYITKQILPPLQRVFSLLGVDVFSWYNDLPRIVRSNGVGEPELGAGSSRSKGTLLGYFTSLSCPVCDARTQPGGLCDACRRDPQRIAVITSERIHQAQRRYANIAQVCRCVNALSAG